MLLNIYSTCQVFVRRWKRWMAGSSTRNICWRPASKVKHQNHAIHIISCSLLILDPFLSSFSWSNICRLPPLTMNNYSFVCFLFDQCCTQHQSQIWNKEVVKQSQRKGEKVQRTLTKRTEVSLGDFFYERSQSSPFYDKTIKQYLECCFCRYNQVCVKAKVKVLIAQYAFTLLITKHQRRSKNPLIRFWNFSHCVFFACCMSFFALFIYLVFLF